MTTASEERTDRDHPEQRLLEPALTLLILVAVIVLAAFWTADGRAGLSGQQVADPVAVRIPAIGVDAPVGPLFLDGGGVLPPPDSYEGTGWWHAGPEPGEVGPALIAGHVDSVDGPAVFFRLDELQPGAEIHVDRADGSTVTFLAQRTERHAKDEFPTDAVYGDTPDPQLRLVTCGGAFDADDRRYLDNVIVYAAPAPA